MAGENLQKKLVGYAISSNSLLERMVDMTETTYNAVTEIQSTVITGANISEKIADQLETQTSILVEIRDLLKDPSKAVKSSGGGGDMKKLSSAGGLVALMGLGLITFVGAFKMAGAVTSKEILSAIGVSIAMIPISKAFAEVVTAMPTSLLMNPTLMVKMMLALSAMSVGYTMIAIAIRATPMLKPEKLLNSIAVAGVLYIVGSVFAKLLEAMTNRGLF